MPKVTVDGVEIEVPQGATVLQAEAPLILAVSRIIGNCLTDRPGGICNA